MIPCIYSDIGKKARDLIEKGFPLSKIALDHKGTTSQGLEIKLSGSHPFDTNQPVEASFETKFKHDKNGLTLSEKLSTGNIWTTTFTLEEKLVEGLKNSLEIVFEPPKSSFSTKFHLNYKRPYLNFATDLKGTLSAPVLVPSIVFGCTKAKGFFLGGSAILDLANKSLSKWEVGVGIDKGSLQMNGSIQNRKDLSYSIYHKQSDNLELGLNLKYSLDNHSNNIAACVKYVPTSHPSVSIKTKVNSNSLITVAHGFKILDQATLTLVGQIDGKNLQSSNHRVGLNIELEA